ncbi:MAG: YceI family protein [Bacillota bacterium]
MKRAMGSMLGAALLTVLLVSVAGCGGSQQPKGSDEAKPATSETSKPATSETSKPATSETSKPATSETSKPATSETSKPATSETSKPATGTYAVVAGESQASYEVKEVFLVDSLNATAIGTTTAIKGELKLKDGAFQPSTVEVDVSALKSDRSQRDNQLKRRGLETEKYPTATFTVSGAEGLKLVEGQEASFKLTGRATIHGVEQELTWDATAKLEGGTLKLSATTEFKMDYFKIEPPNIAGRIRVDDGVKLKVNLVAKQ